MSIKCMDIHEKYAQMSEQEKLAFTLGRESVLNDFDNVCMADAFMGFTAEEWQAVKKFFAFNNALRKANEN